MAEYTKLEHAQIEAILSNYDVGSITSFSLLSGGSENTNYKLNTEAGVYVLTVCEQKSKKEALILADLLAHLEQNQFNTSKVITSQSGERVGLFQHKPIMLKNHLPGTISKNLPLDTLHSLGQQLAKLHLISAPSGLAKTVTFGKESFAQIEAYDKGSSFHRWLVAIHNAVDQHCNTELPKALIHGDLFYDNVIISPESGVATIMDFEEACYYYRVFDIGMTMAGLCEASDRLNTEKAQAVLSGYQQVSGLQDNEKQALQTFTAYAAAATAFWRHKQFRSVLPDTKLENHYLHMKDLADDVLSIPQEAFLGLLT